MVDAITAIGESLLFIMIGTYFLASETGSCIKCRVPAATGRQPELCAIVSTPGFLKLGLKEGDSARLLFSANAVILQSS